MYTKAMVFLAAAMCSASANAGSELMVTTESAKGGVMAVGFDLVSDGSVAGFSFTLDLLGAESKALRSSNCVSQVPKGFTASCVFLQGKVSVIATADAMGQTLPAGVQSVGSISLSGGLSKAGSLRVFDFETSNDNGVSTAGSAKVDGVDMGDTAAETVAQ